MTGQGVTTVARQEFRLRIRAGRWKWLLGAWFVLLVLFTILATAAVGSIEGLDDDGVPVYGAVVLFVLGLALLVVPSLSAQSVNGDRERGTLACLQVTRLTPGDIALGKFLAAWGTTGIFLALSLPVVLFTLTQGGVSLGRVVVVTTLLALLLGTVCAISLYLSSALARTTTSGVLSYLAVGALTLGTLIVFGLGTLATQEDYTETYLFGCRDATALQQYYEQQQGRGPVPEGCQTDSYQSTRTRTDRIWWLLAPNPFVIVADAAPRLGPIPQGLSPQGLRNAGKARDLDLLGQLGEQISELREPPGSDGFSADAGLENALSGLDDDPPAVWPYGLAFDLGLAGLCLWLTSRRLRTPSRELPKGARVA